MSRASGYVLIGAGVAVIVLGSIGLAASDEEEPAAAAGPGSASGVTATTGATGGPAATGVTAATGPTGPTASGSVPVEVESPEAFLAGFGAALRSGDATFLFARLHPAVIDLYGEEQCRAWVGGFSDPNADFTLLSFHGPATFPWVTEGQTIPVEDVYNVRVQFAGPNGTVKRTIHFGIVDGELRWFTDCGDPV